VGTESAGPVPRYRLFGLTLESAFPFRTPLRETDRPADLRFACSRDRPSGRSPGLGEQVHESAARLDSGAPLLTLRHGDGVDVIRYTEVADFYLADDRIDCHLLDPAYDFMIEIHLLGLVLSYWQERRGVPVLHASAVAVDHAAAVFMATHGGGKSSLAATLVAGGHPLVSDDLVGMVRSDDGWVARQGFASMRLWPDQAARFVDHWETLPLAHPRHQKRLVPVGAGGFGTFLDRPVRIGAFYLPERREATSDVSDATIGLTRVPPREAVMELVRGSFLPGLVERGGLAASRLAVFGDLAARVPVVRLSYPDGFEHLPRVGDAVAADVARRVAEGADG
jgi:hypothetical protein